MDIKHVLSRNPLRPAYAAAAAAGARRRRRRCGWLDSTAAWSRSATTGDGFAFDNEGPRHQRLLEPLRARRPAR